MPTNVAILVYVGSPLDYTKYRHTALFFEFPGGSTCAMHVEGSPGFFEFQPIEGYHPEQSRRIVRNIPVAVIPDHFGEASIRGVVSRTPVKNGRENADWNCQNWVGDALTRMVSCGYLNASQRASAIDQMIDACLEAKDE